MSEAAYDVEDNELHIHDVLDRFIRQVEATTDLIWAGANNTKYQLSESSIPDVAHNLNVEAWYVRKRFDAWLDEESHSVGIAEQ